MGHPTRGQMNRPGLMMPLPVLLPLAVVDTLVVVLPTAPWLCQPGHPFRVLLTPFVGIAIGLLLGVQTLLWQIVRNWWIRSRAEADAAFAGLADAAPAVTISEPVDELAALFVEWIPERWGRVAWFDVYVDDRPVWSVPGERLSTVTVSEGRHQVFIKVNHMVSDVIEVDLSGGEVVHLACGMKPLVRNRFFRSCEWKLLYIATPVALVAFYIPAVKRFIERHFAAEFVAITLLGSLGFYLSLPRLFRADRGRWSTSWRHPSGRPATKIRGT